MNTSSKEKELDTLKYNIKEDVSFENIISSITDTIKMLPYELKIFRVK